ncbi:disease resistance protein RGA5-like [Hordeum vulgare subsp. vulgare]|uniref:disease resistance protein RGA5-like n=1 Tax=Hordeum vulgare subsp. vulgare TaxID=112509 RepID=UPI001D1A4481|nr:disease resistance protein RGA5-like [Hordeum vulgare subsp. vulgare]
MAMEFATGAMGTLLPKLGGLLLEEYNLKKSVKKGIGDLKKELESMQAALVKLSSVPLDQLDHQVKIWANEVRELSYAIEDSLDSSMVRIEGLEQTKPNIVGFFKKTRNKITKFKARHEIANNIKDIECKIMKVKERYERYKIDDVIPNPGITTVDPRLSVLYRKASDLVGIAKAIDDIGKKLSMADDPSEKKATTISIVGSGGLGKTTLAKAVYDKHSKKFDCAGFVPVGRNPDIKKVLKDIIFEFDMQMYNAASTMDERQLINLLQKFLLDKKYVYHSPSCASQ